MANVSGIIKSIQDIMRKDAGTYGDAQRLEQLGWMFFLKIFDDREKEIELLRDNYRSPLPAHLRWSAWATNEEGITGEPLLDFVNNTLLPKLKGLPAGTDKIAGLIRMSFEDANNYMKNGTLTLPANANIHAKEYQLYLPSKELLQQKLLDWIRDTENAE